jgi:hypothetical protein
MPHLDIDRRSLLIGAGAAFVVLAAIAAQTNSPQPWQPIPFHRTAAIAEIESRNDLRRVARLSLLDVDKELIRMESAYPTPFTQWCRDHPDIVGMMKVEVLEEKREEYGNPKWVPTGMLSGGGLLFAVCVQEELRRRFDCLNQLGGPP